MLSKKALLWNGGFLLFGIVLFFFFAPVAANIILFQGVLLNWPYLFALLIGIAIAWPLFKGLNGKRARRSIIGLIAITASVIISWIAMGTFSNYLTYHAFANFDKRAKLVASDPQKLRFTPRKIAFKDIENSITAATEEVVFKYTHPLVTDKGFGYVSAITPDGLLPTWNSNNPGFVRYDDSRNVQSGKKVRRLDQPQAYGLGEYWTDNFWWGVYHTDWFATYEEPHFIPLDPESPNKLTGIVPKIKYSWLRLPYWGGVLLVHDNGEIEDLSVEDAKKDPRLKGKWIAPVDLMRDYVEHQDYAVGYINSFFRVPGKLEIDDVEGLNKFPYITRGADKRDYFVVATKAEGSGGGLFRMYYATADNFQLSYFEFGVGQTVYGPNAASKRVYNLKGHIWAGSDEKTDGVSESSSNKATVIEPVYIVRPGDEENLFWKFSITTLKFTGISGTAVVNAGDLDKYKEFEKRPGFESWLNSTKPLHASFVNQLENQTGQQAPDGLSLADQIRWHANQIRVLTQQMQK